MKHTIIPILLSCRALAGTPAIEAAATVTPANTSACWLNVTPYGWVAATEGDMGVAGRVAPVDISMKDTLEDLELAFMMAVEGGIGRWAFGFDGIYGAFSDGSNLPPAAAPFTDATVDFDQFFSRLHAGYQIVAAENATLTAFAGVRFSYLSNELTLNNPSGPDFSAEKSEFWVDPVIGLHGVWDLNASWFIHGGGDIGGFGVSSDLIWQANLALGYRCNERISLLAGYRGLGVDYSDGGFLTDTVAHGPVIGMSMRF
jgi:hypothetical protein